MSGNPMGREYTCGEWAAARRQGIAGRPGDGGVLVWATGPWWPTQAREKVALAQRDARDWELLANAMDREWQKPLPDPIPYEREES